MSAEILRRAAADLRAKAKRADDLARDPAYGEVTGGPNAHWSAVFLEGAILGHPHVVDDDPRVREVVAAGAALLAALAANPAVALAVADLMTEAADEWDEYLWPLDRPLVDEALTVARAYLGEAS